jgi:DNA-binding CsgD family transcriptional regulator/PAS domain-containing protein
MCPDVDAVLRGTPTPLVLVEAPSAQLAAANPAFKALLRLDGERLATLDLFSFTADDDRPIVEAVLGGVASGRTHSYRGRWRWRRADGESIDVVASVQPFRHDTPRALVAAVPSHRAIRPAEAPVIAAASPPLLLATISQDWIWSDITADATALLGWEPEALPGRTIQATVHPDDLVSLLLAVGRSGAERRSVTVPMRLRSDRGDWIPLRCSLGPLCHHNPPLFAVAAMAEATDGDTEGTAQRAARLESHLWRIAAEIEAAGIVAPENRGILMGHPEVQGLSGRQSEVLRRLLRGQRVPAIAKDLYVSPSTVRNHLAHIYRRLGVHSQAELLARLRPIDA